MIKLKYNRFADQELSINIKTGLKTVGFTEGTREITEFTKSAKDINNIKPKYDVSNVVSGITKEITELDKLKAMIDSVEKSIRTDGAKPLAERLGLITESDKTRGRITREANRRQEARRTSVNTRTSLERFTGPSQSDYEAAVNVLSPKLREQVAPSYNKSAAAGIGDKTALEQTISKYRELTEAMNQSSQSSLPNYLDVLKEIDAEMQKAAALSTKQTSFYATPGTLGNDISPSAITQPTKTTAVTATPMFSQLSLADTSKLTEGISAIEQYKNKMEELRKSAEEVANKSLKDLYNGIEQTSNEADDGANKLQKLTAVLNKMPRGIDGITKAFKNLDFSKIVYLAHTVKRVTSVLVDMVDSAADYEESLNLYRMALGEYADEASKWEELISEKLMLDPADVMKYTGAFYNLVKGLGATKDAAFLMSKNLTQLTYDMASYLNISNDAAQAKIQSAMAGQSRAVATVGVATQMASLQELAYSLNIKKKVSEMTQSEKTYLRYIQLMRSTTQMQGDLGRTMITPANAIRTLKNQIELLARALGQVLTPIIMKVIPIIMALTNVLRKAAQSIAGLLGYKLSDVDWSSAFSFDGADEAADKLDSVGKSAKAAGDSVRNALAPFDELNQVMFESSGSGGLSGGGGSGGLSGDDWAALLPSYDMLKDYTDELASKAKDLEGTIGKIVAAVGGFLLITKAIDLVNKLKDGFDGLEKAITGVFGADKAAGIVGTIKSVVSWLGILAGSIITLQGTSSVLKETLVRITKMNGEIDSTSALAIGGSLGLQGALVGVLAKLNPLAGGLAAEAAVVVDYVAAVDAYEQVWQEIIDADIYGTLSISSKQWVDMLKEEGGTLQDLMNTISDYNTDLSILKKSYDDANQSVSLYELRFRATGKATKEETKSMIDSIKTMAESSKNYIDTNTNQMLTLWKDRFGGLSAYTEDEQKEILNGIITYGNNQKKELKNAQDNITTTYDKAIKKRGYLTDEEYNYIETQLAKIRELTETNMSESATNLEYIHGQYTNNVTQLDKESYATWKEAAKQYRDGENSSISTWYNEQYNNLVQSKKKLGWTEEKFQAEVSKLGEERKTKEKNVSDTITKYQDDILLNLANKYIDAGKVQTEENARIQESIAGIFEDSEIDETHLKEIFKQAGIDADDTLVDSFKEQAKGEKSKNGWTLVGESATDLVKNGWQSSVPVKIWDMLLYVGDVLGTDSKKLNFMDKIMLVGNAITGFVFDGMINSVAGPVGEFFTNMGNKLKEKLNLGGNNGVTALFNQVGGHILDAIMGKKGMSNSKSIGTAASSFASTMLNKVKSALGIKSPSRLFIHAHVGDYIVQGIEVGMNSEIDSGIGNVANNLMNTMQHSLDESNDIEFANKLSTGIEEVTEGFKDMNEEILEFNKNANNIAINSNVTASRKITNDYNDIMGLVSGSYATDGNNATNLVETVRDATNTNNTIIVQIGDETVYQGQGQYQSRESERYGTSYVKI